MRTFILSTLAICLLSNSIADAQLFKRRAARKASRQACPGGVCTQPGTGPLTVNPNGGFEGSLPDSAFTQYAPTYTAQQYNPQPTVAVAQEVQPLILQPAAPERSIVVEAEAAPVKSDAAALREALKINLETMAKIVEGLDKVEQMEAQATSAASDLVANMGTATLSIKTPDGERSAETDLGELYLNSLKK